MLLIKDFAEFCRLRLCGRRLLLPGSLGGVRAGRDGLRLGVAGILCGARGRLCGRALRVEGPRAAFWGRIRNVFGVLDSILWLSRRWI